MLRYGSWDGSFRGAGASYGSLGVSQTSGYGATRGLLFGLTDFVSSLYMGPGGGGGHWAVGGFGGGAISIEAGTMILNSGASISALGQAAQSGNGGSGAGGTVVIKANDFRNLGGVINVTGGQTGAKGGDGRTAIYYNTCGAGVCPDNANSTLKASYYIPNYTKVGGCTAGTFTLECISDSAD